MMRTIFKAGAIVLAGGLGAAAQETCPAGVARDGVWLTFPDRTVLTRVLPDGRIHEMEFGRDGTYIYGYVTLPIGLIVEGYELQNGVSPRDGRESVTYAGTPDPIPAPVAGARFDGIEMSRYGDGFESRSTINLVVGAARPVTIGGCVYTGLPVDVTRVELNGGLTQRDSMMHLSELGLTIFVGFSEGDAPPAVDLPLSISREPPAPEGGAEGGTAPPPLPPTQEDEK